MDRLPTAFADLAAMHRLAMRCLCLLRCGEGRGTNLTEGTVGLAEPDDGVTLDFSHPGKPTENGFIYAFNSKFRAECLNADFS